MSLLLYSLNVWSPLPEVATPSFALIYSSRTASPIIIYSSRTASPVSISAEQHLQYMLQQNSIVCSYNAPWEWQPLGVAALGSGSPWEWRPLGVAVPGSGGPWEWRPLGVAARHPKDNFHSHTALLSNHFDVVQAM